MSRPATGRGLRYGACHALALAWLTTNLLSTSGRVGAQPASDLVETVLRGIEGREECLSSVACDVVMRTVREGSRAQGESHKATGGLPTSASPLGGAGTGPTAGSADAAVFAGMEVRRLLIAREPGRLLFAEDRHTATGVPAAHGGSAPTSDFLCPLDPLAWTYIDIFDGQRLLTIHNGTVRAPEGRARARQPRRVPDTTSLSNARTAADTPGALYARFLGIAQAGDLVRTALGRGQVGRERSSAGDSRPLLHVSFFLGVEGASPARVDWWIAPHLGYAVTREVWGGEVAQSIDRRDFRPFGKGSGEVWLPTTVEVHTHYPRGARLLDPRDVLILRHVTFDLTALRPLLDLTVDQLPPGYSVTDMLAGGIYYHTGPVDRYDDAIAALADDVGRFRRDGDLRRLQKEAGAGRRDDLHSGPRALLLLCSLCGVATGTSELAKASGTDMYGTTLEGLAEAARQKGLTPRRSTVPANDLGRGSLPAIVERSRNNFVLILGTTQGTVVTLRPPTRIETLPVSWVAEAVGQSLQLLSLEETDQAVSRGGGVRVGGLDLWAASGLLALALAGGALALVPKGTSTRLGSWAAGTAWRLAAALRKGRAG